MSDMNTAGKEKILIQMKFSWIKLIDFIHLSYEPDSCFENLPRYRQVVVRLLSSNEEINCFGLYNAFVIIVDNRKLFG